MKTMTLFRAITDFFGRKPMQTMKEFFDEVKSLNEDDMAYFKLHLEKTGLYKIETNAEQDAKKAKPVEASRKPVQSDQITGVAVGTNKQLIATGEAVRPIKQQSKGSRKKPVDMLVPKVKETVAA